MGGAALASAAGAVAGVEVFVPAGARFILAGALAREFPVVFFMTCIVDQINRRARWPLEGSVQKAVYLCTPGRDMNGRWFTPGSSAHDPSEAEL